MNNLELLRDIRSKLTDGVVTIKTDNPRGLRNSLYRMARRRGYRWKFATEKKAVQVYQGVKVTPVKE